MLIDIIRRDGGTYADSNKLIQSASDHYNIKTLTSVFLFAVQHAEDFQNVALSTIRTKGIPRSIETEDQLPRRTFWGAEAVGIHCVFDYEEADTAPDRAHHLSPI